MSSQQRFIRCSRSGLVLVRPSLLWACLHPRRYHGTGPTPWQSEERVSNWCCRLWGLTQGCRGVTVNGGGAHARNSSTPPLLSSSALSHAINSSNGRSSNGGGAAEQQGLLDEMENHKRLVDELKAVMVGEKGRLPASVVESVWNVYESIIPPDAVNDIPRCVTPTEEKKFFEFLGLLTELDFSLTDVKVAAEKLTRNITYIENLLESVQECEKKNESDGKNTSSDASALSAKLVTAKNDLLRQCIAVRQVGSPIYYVWLRQSVSLERGMKRLMDLRRCVTYFKEKCHERLLVLQTRKTKNKHEEKEQPLSELMAIKVREDRDLWVMRQRHVSCIDGALEFLFSELFAKEWLVMEELTWHTTPPSLLEQVIAAEGVHPFFGGLSDMKRRLQPARNRHLFAFFHPAVVEEPLIAVQVALTHGIAASVDRILGRPSPLQENEEGKENVKYAEETRELLRSNNSSSSSSSASNSRNSGEEEEVNTATFYSINSTQSALRGVNLGNLLIKRVVREIEARLNAERRSEGLPPITTFSTLSPIPGYIPWLTMEVSKLQQYVLHGRNGCMHAGNMKFSHHRIFGDVRNDDEVRLFSQLRKAVLDLTRQHSNLHADLAAQLSSLCSGDDDTTGMSDLITMQFLLCLFRTPEEANAKFSSNGSVSCKEYFPWWEERRFTRAIERPLLRSVARYLYNEKRRGRILDPVGNFHISNGATMWRLNFLGNCSPAGSRESATVMVNYLYSPARVSEQVNAYEVHRTVSVGENVLQYLGTK